MRVASRGMSLTSLWRQAGAPPVCHIWRTTIHNRAPMCSIASVTVRPRRHIPHLFLTHPRALCASSNEGSAEIVSPIEYKINIRSFYIAQTINHRALTQKLFADYPHRLLRDCSLVSLLQDDDPRVMKRVPDHRHVCILDYGSVVFFNCDESLIQDLLVRIAEFCAQGSPQTITPPLSESYRLVLRSSLDQWFSVGPDQVLLRSFSLDTIRTITEILGQTVALQAFENQVEDMLEKFSKLNSEVARKGEKFFQYSQTDLFKMIASNNKVLTDVILTLNLLDRPETAWKYSTQSDLWDALRLEFDIAERFKALDFKLNLVSENCQFFLNMLHSTKSSRLELIIIILIGIEIVLGVIGLTIGRH